MQRCHHQMCTVQVRDSIQPIKQQKKKTTEDLLMGFHFCTAAHKGESSNRLGSVRRYEVSLKGTAIAPTRRRVYQQPRAMASLFASPKERQHC